jgi:hypothetical protein
VVGGEAGRGDGREMDDAGHLLDALVDHREGGHRLAEIGHVGAGEADVAGPRRIMLAGRRREIDRGHLIAPVHQMLHDHAAKLAAAPGHHDHRSPPPARPV